jgi:hypothetical protein
MLKKLRTLLGRVIRDIGRKIEGNGGLEVAFAKLLLLARRVHQQKQHQRGPKVYSLHAPEVECIGKARLIELIDLTSSASRSALPPPSSTARAASSSPT